MSNKLNLLNFYFYKNKQNLKNRLFTLFISINPFLYQNSFEPLSYQIIKTALYRRYRCKSSIRRCLLGCSANQMILKNGVEANIKKYVPHIEQVISID